MTTPSIASAPAPAPPTPAEIARMARIRHTAQDFEASFLSSMFQTMFEGTEQPAPFGGGQSETAWRSFLTDAMSRQVVRAGGIGLADSVAREMLRLQAAGEAVAAPPSSTPVPDASPAP